MFAARFPAESFYKWVILVRVDIGRKGCRTDFHLKRPAQCTQFYLLPGFFDWGSCSYLKLNDLTRDDTNFIRSFDFGRLVVTTLDQNLNIAYNGIQRVAIPILDDDHGQVVFPGSLRRVPHNFPRSFINAQVVFRTRAHHIGKEVIGYLYPSIRKRNNQLVRQTIPIRVVSIGVVDKRFADTTYVDWGLQQYRGIVAAIYLWVGKSIGSLDVEFDLFRVREVEVDDAPVAVWVIHRNDVGAPRRVGVKSDVNVLTGIVFQQFPFANAIHPDRAIDPQYLLTPSSRRFVAPKNG